MVTDQLNSSLLPALKSVYLTAVLADFFGSFAIWTGTAAVSDRYHEVAASCFWGDAYSV